VQGPATLLAASSLIEITAVRAPLDGTSNLEQPPTSACGDARYLLQEASGFTSTRHHRWMRPHESSFSQPIPFTRRGRIQGCCVTDDDAALLQGSKVAWFRLPSRTDHRDPQPREIGEMKAAVSHSRDPGRREPEELTIAEQAVASAGPHANGACNRAALSKVPHQPASGCPC